MSNFPVDLKQIDRFQLSGFITGVAKSGVFDVFLQGYIAQSGFFGTHIVYTTGNQDISGYKFFASGASGPIATGSGQYIPLAQLTGLSGFVSQQFYPLNTNPSGYITGAVQGITTSGSSALIGTVDFTGTSGIIVIQSGQTMILSGNDVTAIKVTGSDEIKGIVEWTGSSGVALIRSGNHITVSGQTGDFYPNYNPSGFLNFGVTGILVSGNYNNAVPTIHHLTGEIEFKGISGVRTFLSGSTIFISGLTGGFFPRAETGLLYPLDGNPSGFLDFAVTGIVIDGVAFTGEVFFTGVSGVTVYNDGQTIYWSGNTGDFFPRYETGLFYPADGNPSGYLTPSDIPGVTGIIIGNSGTITGEVLFTGTSGIQTLLSGQTVIISGTDGWQVTGSAIKNSVVNFTGTAGSTVTVSGNTVIISGQKNDVKSRFYGVFGSPSTNGDFNVVAGGTNGTSRLNFYAPNDFQSLVSLQAVGICSAGAAQTARNIDLTSDYGAIGETSTNHSESNTTITYDLSAAAGRITGLDVSSVFTSLAAEDFCGILMTHNTIGGNFNYIGILLKYR